jgi:competence protein ComGC
MNKRVDRKAARLIVMAQARCFAHRWGGCSAKVDEGPTCRRRSVGCLPWRLLIGLRKGHRVRYSVVSMKLCRRALTLIELVVVLTILVALAGLVVPRLFATGDQARIVATDASLVEIRKAVERFWIDCKFDADQLLDAERRLRLSDLLTPRPGFRVFDPRVPDANVGWNGPYLEPSGVYRITGTTAEDYTDLYGEEGELAVLDAWQRPFVIQEFDSNVPVGLPRDVRIVSAGPDGLFQITDAMSSNDLLTGLAHGGDDVYVAITLR